MAGVRYSFPIILILLVRTALTFLLRPLPLSNLSSISTNQTTISILQPSTNIDYQCFTTSPFIRRPSYIDCLLAITELPSDPDPGVFHNDGPLFITYVLSIGGGNAYRKNLKVI